MGFFAPGKSTIQHPPNPRPCHTEFRTMKMFLAILLRALAVFAA